MPCCACASAVSALLFLYLTLPYLACASRHAAAATTNAGTIARCENSRCSCALLPARPILLRHRSQKPSCIDIMPTASKKVSKFSVPARTVATDTADTKARQRG